jgi:hypothetical protein
MDMLATDSLRFIKHFGSISYAGVTQYYPLPPGTVPLQEYAPHVSLDGSEAIKFACVIPSEQAISLYLNEVRTNAYGELADHIVRHLTSLVIRQTIEVELRKSFTSKVTDQTARDITDTPKLAAFFQAEAEGQYEILTGTEHQGPRLSRFEDLKPDEFRAFRSLLSVMREPNEFDHVDCLLWMAASNFEMALAEGYGAEHILVQNPIREVLMGRARRAGLGQRKLKEFAKLETVSEIPSLPDAFAERDVKFSDIWRLRDSAKGQEFRAWFNKSIETQASDIRDAYIATLQAEGWATSLPVRVLRFLGSSGIGLFLNPALGSLAAASDIVLDDALKPWKPTIFLDDLRKTLRKAKPTRKTG